MNYEFWVLALAWYGVLLFSFIVHEVAHGFAALKLGDPTAYSQGQVTFDPIAHIRREPVGMVIVPLVSFLMFHFMMGWASTPIDPHWAHHHRRKAAVMSLAGPAANLLLVLIAAVVIKAGIAAGIFVPPDAIGFTRLVDATGEGLIHSLAVLVGIFFTLNLILLSFNLIPFPPLDGSDILNFFLPEKVAVAYMQLLGRPQYRLMGLLAAWLLFPHIFSAIYYAAIQLLYPGMY